MEAHGLARQFLELPVIGEVELEVVTSLLAHHVEDRALQIAVLGGGADPDDLDFVDDIGVDPGNDPTGVGPGEVRAVHESVFSFCPEPKAEIPTPMFPGRMAEIPGADFRRSKRLILRMARSGRTRFRSASIARPPSIS